MIEHPGIELQVLIKEKGLTQKAFSSILGKKVSEVNELLKGKRNITIQRDYLLHQTLGTPIKYWILKQVDYDYSLLDIEESSNSPLDKEGLGEIGSHPEQSEVYSASGESSEHYDVISNVYSASGDSEKSTEQETSYSELSENSETSPLDKGDAAKPRGFEQPQETPTQEPDFKDDEDLKNRANIFRTF